MPRVLFCIPLTKVKTAVSENVVQVPYIFGHEQIQTVLGPVYALILIERVSHSYFPAPDNLHHFS